jgi:hypothetical protein
MATGGTYTATRSSGMKMAGCVAGQAKGLVPASVRRYSATAWISAVTSRGTKPFGSGAVFARSEPIILSGVVSGPG